MSPSIVGVGLDIVELERIAGILERHPERFLARICRAGEVLPRGHRATRIQHIGGLFAAKEAVLKALGTGWADGLTLRDVEISRRESGAPLVHLHRRARERASEMGVAEIHLSITHERAYACAVAILQAEPGYHR